MRRLVALALAGCATAGHPDSLNADMELGMTAMPAPAQFTDPPEQIDLEHAHVERTAPVAAAAETTPSPTRAATLAGVVRTGFLLFEHVVVAYELELGRVQSSAGGFASTEAAVHIGIVGALGLVTRVDRLSLGAELAAGLRIVERTSADRAWSFREDRQLVEPRVRADVWILPWLAVGTYAALDRAGVAGAGFRFVVAAPDDERQRRRRD